MRGCIGKHDLADHISASERSDTMEVEIFFEDFEAEEKAEMTDSEMIECLIANCILRITISQCC